jgi:hypothetical protein
MANAPSLPGYTKYTYTSAKGCFMDCSLRVEMM